MVKEQLRADNSKLSLFAGDMWVVFNFADANERHRRFLNNAKPRFSNFIDGLLLYEKVVVPTEDFVSLAVLISVLGQATVHSLLESGDLKIVRLCGSMSYWDRGSGLSGFKVLTPDQKPHPQFDHDEATLNWALSGLLAYRPDKTFKKKVLDSLTSLDIKDVQDTIRKETALDIADAPELRAALGITSTDIDHLPSTKDGKVQFYGGPDTGAVNDDINVVLRIANANLELLLADRSGCIDGTTSNPIGHMIKAKLDRASRLSAFQGLSTLLSIDDIPDVASFILDADLEERGKRLEKLMKLKHSRDGESFRQWFHDTCRNDPTALAKSYVDLLKQEPSISSFGARVIRLVIGYMVGAANPVVGAVAGVADSLFVDRLMRGVSPKFFIEKLNQYVTENVRKENRE